ncbi:MAG: molybdopterin-dependent oxidoreductase [Acidilobaceae archaeon]|nr:molybdopterin-dependent oxidoreductase [Acidilobaceae archaeon]
MGKLSRRDFIKVAGVAAAAASIPIVHRYKPYEALLAAVKDVEPFEAHSVPGICGMCMAQCAIYVDVVNNVPVRIRPNTNAPTSSMGICSRGVSGMYNAFLNPDRLTKPLVRKPLLDWIEGKISWEEAHRRLKEVRGTEADFVEVDDWWKVAEIIARKLKELADAGERHALVFLYGAWGPIASMRLGVPLARFLDAFGSPNEIQFDMPACVTATILGHTLTGVHGHQAAHAVTDYLNARAIVVVRRNNLGSGVVTSGWRLGVSRGEGAKLIAIDPAFSETAGMADIWLPARPGTDLAIILAAIRFVLENPHYMDVEYLKRYTNAPHLVVVTRGHRLSGLPIPIAEVDWAHHGLPEPTPARVAFTVIDSRTRRPSPDDATMDPALEGTFRIRLKDGSEVEAKTVLTLLREWVTANLDALAKARGVVDYIEAVAKEADVPVERLRQAIKTIVEERALFDPGWHDPRFSNSAQIRRAMDILMALYGKIQRPGGLFVATHLYGAHAALYARLKLTVSGNPFYSIRGDTISAYNSKFAGPLHIIPLVPPLPGPAERGAPAIPRALTAEWASMMAAAGYPILFPYHQVQALYDAVVHGKPYKVKVIMMFGTNPIPENPNVEMFKKIFKEVELAVIHDVVFNDTALYSDIVLPDMTYLERLDLPLVGTFSPFPAVSVRFPWYYRLYKEGKIKREVRPFNVRTGFEVLLMVAKKLQEMGVKARDGTEFSANMPVTMLDEEGKFPLDRLETFVNNIFRRVMIREKDGTVRRLTIDDIYKAGGYLLFRFTGTTTTIVDELWSRALGREVRVTVPVWEAFQYDVKREKEFWVMYHHSSRVGLDIPFPTPTGRIEIYSVELAREIKDVLKRDPLEVRPDILESSPVDQLFSPIPLYAGKALPDYVWGSRLPATPGHEVNGLKEPDPARGELFLVYRHSPFTHTHMSSQNNPLLNKITAKHLYGAWIHPETAKRIGVKDGDWVIVEPAVPKVLEQLKAAGVEKVPKMKIKVRVTTMVRPDVLYMVHGWPTESKRETVRLKTIREFRDPEFGVTDDNYFIPFVTVQLGGSYALGTGVVKVSKFGG